MALAERLILCLAILVPSNRRGTSALLRRGRGKKTGAIDCAKAPLCPTKKHQVMHLPDLTREEEARLVYRRGGVVSLFGLGRHRVHHDVSLVTTFLRNKFCRLWNAVV